MPNDDLADAAKAATGRVGYGTLARAMPVAFPRSTHDSHMPAPDLNWIANYMWDIDDDVVRDVYVRGKYHDVILPMRPCCGTSMLCWSPRSSPSST